MRVRNLLNKTIIIVAFAFTGCQSPTNNLQVLAEEKPRVVASHSVLCHFIEKIARDTIELTCLMDGTQNPHTYRPTPSQSKALEKARVIFYGGYDLEPQIIDLIEAVDDKILKLAVYEAVVTDPIKAEHHHDHESEAKDEHHHDRESEAEDEHHHDHESEAEDEHHHDRESEATDEIESSELEPDPHIWHDVYNAIATVEYLKSALLQLNPEQATTYLENSAKLTEELKQLHVWIQEQIATIPEGQRILVSTHDALNYYIKAYELESYKTLQGLNPNDSPSASDLRKLVGEIQQTKVPTIFAEATTNNRVINNVAREAGVKLSDRQLLVDGLGESGTETDSYIKMMVNNTCAIVDGLEGKCQAFTN